MPYHGFRARFRAKLRAIRAEQERSADAPKADGVFALLQTANEVRRALWVRRNRWPIADDSAVARGLPLGSAMTNGVRTTWR